MGDEKIFRAFTAEQGAHYAQNRPSYSRQLYDVIIEHHQSTGGRLGTVVDVGCGPGIATRQVAGYFDHAVGLDPSEGMISTARSLGGTARSADEPIRYAVSSAEELGAGLTGPDLHLEDGSVDLITAATAAHWFDMDRFWPRAAALLRPGGTVALWTSRPDVHPSTPCVHAIQAALDHLAEVELQDYYQPGAVLGFLGLYRDLPLPWTLETSVEAFDEEAFVRKYQPSLIKRMAAGEDVQGNTEQDRLEFFARPPAMGADAWEKLMGTSSPVIMWRAAHPEAVGTEKDVLRKTRREIETILRQAGVEPSAEMKGDASGVLLLVKKRA